MPRRSRLTAPTGAVRRLPRRVGEAHEYARRAAGKQHAVALSLGTVPVVTNDNRHAERKVLEDAMVNLGLRPLALGVETNPFCTRPIEGSTSCSLWLPTTGALINPDRKRATWP
jgi:hypothetical protein